MTTKKNLTNPQELLKNAVQFIENNQLELAKNILKEGEANFPNEFSFINLLAQISLRNKEIQAGINLLKKSLIINPNQSLVMVDLGIALSINNQLDEAILFFEKSIELDPTNLQAFMRKAITLNRLDRLSDSIDCYQKIIELNPNFVDAYINQAEILNSIGKTELSLSLYQKALEIDPKNARLFIKYGNLLNKLDRVDEALNAYKRSIEIKSSNIGALVNVGYLLKKIKKHDEAIIYLKKSIEIEADPQVLHNIGAAYCSLGNYLEGIVYYDKAIKLKPDLIESYLLKARALATLGKIDQAILCFDKVEENKSFFKNSFGERFNAKQSICDWSNFDNDKNKLELLLKENKSVAAPLVVCNLFEDPAIHKVGAEIYANDSCPLNNILGQIKKYPKNKKIKIGYFSGDFSDHPVGLLIADVLANHDKSKFELFGFSVTKKNNSETRIRIKNTFDEFIDVENHSDKDVALLAREKKIDIAIDLGGYTRSSRPGIFAMRAAPIQIIYLGYPGTMGADYIDYIFSDKFIIPKESRQYYTEKIIYFPKSFQPNVEKLPVSNKFFTRESQGLPATGFVFCCFNNSGKITPKMFKLWIRLLSNVPGSVLWFPEFSDLTINNLRNECKKLGMEPGRLIFSSIEKYRKDHYERIKLADIFLDCYPYGGHSTASDFLRNGIPIVTLKGRSIPNMVASSMLFNLSLSELITSTELDYEKLAIKLATSPGYLKEVKFKLISNIDSSSVFNINEYTNSIESGYSQVYDRHHNSFIPDHIHAK